MINRVILVGNLGKDPQSVKTKNGQIVKLSLATSERRKSGEVVEWHNISIINEKLGQIMMEHAKKGSQLYVEGKIQTQAVLSDPGGETRYYTNIIVGPYDGTIKFLGGRERTGNGQDDAREPVQAARRPAPARAPSSGNRRPEPLQGDDEDNIEY